MNKKHNKTKVLYVITKNNWGGAQRYVFDMASSITKNGYEAVVALGEDPGKTTRGKALGSLKEKLEDAEIRTITIPNLKRDVNIFSEWKVFFDLLRILKEEKPDVVHLNSSKIGGLGALACRIARVRRIIFTAHGWAYKEERNFISKSIIKFFSWLTVVFSHKIITVSKNDFKNAPKLFSRGKIVMIHNGIGKIKFKDKTTARKSLTPRLRHDSMSAEKPFEMFRSANSTNKISKRCTESVRLNLGVRDTVWIGAISELHKNKGLTFVIHAVYSLIKKGYDVVFFIIGDGEEKFRLEQFIKNLGLENNVFLLGHIGNAPELLQAFDIFTLTSLKEGLPYVLLEAGLAGLPIVATNVGGIPEIIKNMKSGMLVHPKNALEAERALSFLIDFKKKRSEFGDALKEKVEGDFTLEQMVAETIVIYE